MVLDLAILRRWFCLFKLHSSYQAALYKIRNRLCKIDLIYLTFSPPLSSPSTGRRLVNNERVIWAHVMASRFTLDGRSYLAIQPKTRAHRIHPWMLQLEPVTDHACILIMGNPTNDSGVVRKLSIPFDLPG
jgi:hypothetical protein